MDEKSPHLHSYPAFWYGLAACLGLGTLLTETEPGKRTAMWVLGIYGAALLFQRLIFDRRYFSWTRRSQEPDREQVVFAGKTTDTEAELERDRRAFDQVLGLPSQLKIRLGSGAIFAGFSILILRQELQMHVTLGLHLAAAMVLVRAVVLNHFMIPLAFNLAAVAYGFTRSGQTTWLGHGAYFLAFVYAVLAYGNTQFELRKQSGGRPIAAAELRFRTLIRAGRLGLAYLLMMGVIDHLITRDPVTYVPSKLESAITLAKTSVSAKVARSLRRPSSSPSGENSDRRSSSLADEAARPPLAGMTEAAAKLGILEPGVEGNGRSEGVLKNADKEAALRALLSPENIRLAQDLLRQRADLAAQAERQRAVASQERPVNAAEVQRAVLQIQKLMIGAITEVASRSLEQEGPLASGLNKKEPVPEPVREPDSEQLRFLLTLALIAGAGLTIGVFIRKVRKKVGPRAETRLLLARDQRMQLLKQLRSINRKRLSQRGEIVARYDLFLKIMEMARTPREPSLPPTDFQRRVRYLHPPLEVQAKRITDTFCDSYYGDQDVPKESVQAMRGAVREVFQYFASTG